MKRTLLTGFGPFGDVINNPSQRLAEHFAAAGAPGHIITTHVFPVSYAAVELQLRSLLGDSGNVPYDIVLMMGVNAGASEWRIERLGTNGDHPASTDMRGHVAIGGVIIPGKPQELKCTLPIERLVGALEDAGIPVVISDSAGGYLCNHLLYRALCRLQTAPEAIAGFVHIPADSITFAPTNASPQREFPSFEMHICAMETILAELT